MTGLCRVNVQASGECGKDLQRCCHRPGVQGWQIAVWSWPNDGMDPFLATVLVKRNESNSRVFYVICTQWYLYAKST